MRAIGFMIAAALFATGPAAAAWQEYPAPQLGYVVEFPAKPTISTGMYKTVLVPSAATHISTVKEDHEVYVASVVDLLDRKEEGATLLGEAEFNLQLLGDLNGQSISRVEPGKDAIFGRFITIDCRSGKVPDQAGQTEAARAWFKSIAGMDCPDKARLTANIFFNRGRLYLIQGINLPTDEGSSFGPAALRFSNSISFYGADGKRHAADNVQ